MEVRMLAQASVVLAVAQEGDDKTSLLDMLPWWWARLILGVVLMVIAAGIYKWEQRSPDAARGFGFLGLIQAMFGIFGAILVLESIGLF
jgi:hypothetical protein